MIHQATATRFATSCVLAQSFDSINLDALWSSSRVYHALEVCYASYHWMAWPKQIARDRRLSGHPISRVERMNSALISLTTRNEEINDKISFNHSYLGM
jgi:hypothetical protein